ncbi:MAG: cytochrome C oxidase assembly protein [Pseudomonadota bacterium]
MALGPEHPHANRKSRSNMLLGLLLAGFVALVFAITVAKMMRGDNMEAFDHVLRPALEVAE